MKILGCRSCGARVIWTFTAAGKRMPVDELPSPEGTFALEDDGDEESMRAVFKPKGSAAELHVSHFATCPQAKTWRKGTPS